MTAIGLTLSQFHPSSVLNYQLYQDPALYYPPIGFPVFLLTSFQENSPLIIRVYVHTCTYMSLRFLLVAIPVGTAVIITTQDKRITKKKKKNWINIHTTRGIRTGDPRVWVA
jgi:hypothetical protein